MRPEDGNPLARRAAEWLLSRKAVLGLPELSIVGLKEFIDEAAKRPQTPPEDRQVILDVTSKVLEELYAHRPFKRVFESDDPNRNPLVALTSLRAQAQDLGEFDFHTSLQVTLSWVRDIHTTYTSPPPYSDGVAFLPFQVGYYESPRNQWHFIVTRLMPTNDDGRFDHRAFQVGAELVLWDGLNLVRAAWLASSMQPGANRIADLARGTSRLTVRAIGTHGVPMLSGPPPFHLQSEAVIRYIAPGEKKKREIRFPWQVATGFGNQPFSSTAFSQSPSSTYVQCWTSVSYKKAESEHDYFSYLTADDPPVPGAPSPDSLRNPNHPEWSFAYLRIANFAGNSPALYEDAKVAEIRDVLSKLDDTARGGLIIDLRGNPGGQIRLAERILQMLSPRTIEPLQFHFVRTPTVLRALDVLRKQDTAEHSQFAPWLDISDDHDPHDPLLPGRPLTEAAIANRIGQVYQSPVVLLTDSITYSAADMFAAGFYDHSIGLMIGVDACTGGGGANAWSYRDVRANVPAGSGIDLPELPGDSDLHIAVRRCTRNNEQRMPIEGIGVYPDIVRPRTRWDLLAGDVDLYSFAIEQVAQRPVYRIDVDHLARTSTGFTVTLRAMGIHYVVLSAGDVVLAEGDVPDGEAATFRIGFKGEVPSEIRVDGYWDDVEFHDGLPPLAAPRIGLVDPNTPGRGIRRWVVNRDKPA